VVVRSSQPPRARVRQVRYVLRRSGTAAQAAAVRAAARHGDASPVGRVTAGSVTIADLSLTVTVAAGEELRTEISAKFRRGKIETELAAAGLAAVRFWTDPDGDFAMTPPRISAKRISQAKRISHRKTAIPPGRSRSPEKPDCLHPL